MKQAKEALDVIQNTAIKACGRNASDLSKQFKYIREGLNQYWDSISSVLRKEYSFAGAVARLQELYRTSNLVEIGLSLQELIEQCKTCKEESHRLIETHKAIMQDYSSTKVSFTNSGGTRRGNGTLPRIDEGAIARFGKAFEGLRKDVENMDAFFEVQLAKCQRFLDAAQGRNKDVSMDESRQFVDQWTGYQELLLKTNSDVCAISDAVTASPDIT
jgi:hypothetical protein